MSRPSGPPSAAEGDAKLTVRLGDREVHLEASPEVVRQELDRVLDRLFPPAEGTAGDAAGAAVEVSVTAQAPRAAEPPAEPEAPSGIAERQESPVDSVARARGRQEITADVATLLRHTTLAPESFADLYAVDPLGRVALRTLPRTRQSRYDALRLLLYGMLSLRGSASPTGAVLMEAARTSGMKLKRVPRGFAEGRLVATFGRRRGKRYRLTAAGVRHCEELIRRLSGPGR